MSERFARHDLVDMFDIEPVPGPPTIQILVVADAAVSFNNPFGIGMAIDTLRQPAHPFVRFEVTLARREQPPPGWDPAGVPRPPTYWEFRFDRTEKDGTLTLHQYDQVWCFGFEPGNTGSPNDDDIFDPSANPLSDSELAVLARWMNERRGGVFASGDHHFLGASMCARVPRVGTMRRWTNAQGVPPVDGPARIDTNRPATPGQGNIGGGNPDPIPNAAQSDAVPQQIEWKRYYSRADIFRSTVTPHPLLCDQRGVIDVMPDHPHEGQVVADADIALTNLYDFDGYAGAEYPTGPGKVQPRPEVIAWGRTLPDPPYNFEKGDSPEKRFPMISVYDGHPAGVGRVVVDSTWHHWMDLNVADLAAQAPAAWSAIQAYYRNIGIWLVTPVQRAEMLVAGLWWSFFDRYTVEEYGEHLPVWALGRSARDGLGRYAGPCQIRQWVQPFVPEELWDLGGPSRLDPEPCLSCPPFELFEIAVLGGIVQALLPYARRSQREHWAGVRWIPNRDDLMPLLAEGARAGLQAAAAVAAEGARRAAELADLLASYDPPVPTHDHPPDDQRFSAHDRGR